ncbi:hypothetical protein B7494_g7973 [Chlorociboria aeruginascens]|nr:hypothetical protein B7494_g7973 [Chlorociboria aeruginascens]
MADEPRRSVRATKGQHTKSHDILDQLEPKKKAAKRGAKKAQDEEVEIIRCVCGATETGDDDGEPWIACDNCSVWQHNICVGVSTYQEDTPDNYLCEQCAPHAHRELLDALTRGEKIWEERRKIHEREQAEEEAFKKKGKKAKAKRTSDLKPEATTNTTIKSPSTPVESKEKTTPARSGSTKRKARDESQDKEKGPSKMRKFSAPQESPVSGLPVKILDIDHDRQGPTKLIKKSLVHAIPIAVKDGLYTLKAEDSVDAKAERLAIQIEEAVFITHPDKESRNKQNRSLFANIKSNQELCNGLLKQTLSPQALAVMTTDDMASKEQKRETAEMKARADKQSIMITDDGPRMRRTHKGDEVIEADNFAVPSDNTMSTSRRRSMLDPNGDMATRSRENSPGDQVELPDGIDDYKSQDDIRSHVIPKEPLHVETKSGPPARKASIQVQNDFDINKVFSSVQSPVGVQHPSAQHMRRPSGNAPPANGPGIDPEIDKLLQDEDGNESPPYSPAEYDSDPDIVWRGSVTMDAVASFPGVARYVGGADMSRSNSWNDILQKNLKVAGRIDQDKANEYLCGLRYNPPTDVTVVDVTPTGEAATQNFHDLLDYFNSKGKYGVLSNKGTGNVRDTYLVPILPSPGKLPDFIDNLEGHKLPAVRTEPKIVIALVIRNEWQPDIHRTTDGANDAHSPLVMSYTQRQMSMGSHGPAMSPIAPQGAFQSQAQGGGAGEADARRQTENQLQKQREGEATAAKILGSYISAPTVHFLMPQAYQMRPVEWQVIKDILATDQKAQQDLQHLSQLLEQRKPDFP